MCRTYDAIYEVRKNVESPNLIVWIDGSKVKGELISCKEDKEMRVDEVITLKDVTTYCLKTGNEHRYKWFNIPSKWIRAFVFECCVID